MADRLPSYSINTQPYITPQESFELNPDNSAPESSIDFVTPSGFSSDFVPRSTGGTFLGVVSYNSEITLSSDTNLTYKAWVEDYVATQITTEALTDTYIRGLFSSAGTTPLTYLAGVFTLDDDLSNYDNSVSAFITAADVTTNETDPIWVAASTSYYTKTNV